VRNLRVELSVRSLGSVQAGCGFAIPSPELVPG